MKIAGVIIAGGKSSRMGEDKLLLKLAGKPIIDHVIARLEPQVERLAINANDRPARFAGYEVIGDIRTTGSPLAGLHAALAWAQAHGFTHVLTVSGDTPFLPADLAARLSQHQVAIARSLDQDHYLIGLWPVEALAELGEDLFRVQDFARLAGAVSVAWPGDPFFNINTPEDLRRAETIAATSD